MYERIADLPNHIAETGETPSVLKTGLLVPHQKPGKKRGPASNIRQVIPLSILRKNNGSVRRPNRKNRGEDQPTNRLPLSQAAYRSGRGTSEQVLTMKLMTEKAVTTPGYNVNAISC